MVHIAFFQLKGNLSLKNDSFFKTIFLSFGLPTRVHTICQHFLLFTSFFLAVLCTERLLISLEGL